jgi:hypothetical protein
VRLFQAGQVRGITVENLRTLLVIEKIQPRSTGVAIWLASNTI